MARLSLTRHRIFAGGVVTKFVVAVAMLFSSQLFAQAPARIAIFGDQGINGNARAVIELAKRESADLILVLGDLAYEQDTPDKWLAQYDDIVGSNFPVLAVVGNHEEDRWPVFKSLLNDRLAQTPEVQCQGDYGVKNVCRFRGITIVGTAPGISEVPGVDGKDDYPGYIRSVLAADDAPFSFCAWHKNMRDMQLGGKSDATGWGVYEACRQNGAVVVTGHEHSYSRTHLMSNFEHLAVRSESNSLVLRPGATTTIVSGLGGVSARVQLRDGDWWASVYTADQNAKRGALFCDFGVNGDPNRASCYFKNVENAVIDRFNLISEVNSDTDELSNVVRRVSSPDDDAEQQISTGDTYTKSSDLELIEEIDSVGEGRGPQLVGVRFQNMTIPAGSEVTSAFLKFETDEPGDRATSLRIHGEASDSAAVFAEASLNISSRTRTSASVNWDDLAAVSWNDSVRSPDLKAVIQEIVSRPGWQSGASLALIISGTGQRVVESFDGEANAAASLFVEYRRMDNNAPTKFSIQDLRVTEADGTARVVVTANPAPTQDTRISYATAGATATAGTDFYGTSGSLLFRSGISQQTFDVAIINDTQLENGEAFVARVFKPDDGEIERGRAVVTIEDDDRDARALSVSDLSVNESAGTAAVQVTLSPASTTSVDVDVATGPETAVNGQDFYGGHQRISFAAGETVKTFNVSIIDDAQKEAAPEFFNIRLFNPSGASLRKSVARINIIDND